MRTLAEKARELLARHQAERLALIDEALEAMGGHYEVEREPGELRVRGRGLAEARLNPAELRFLMERAR